MRRIVCVLALPSLLLAACGPPQEEDAASSSQAASAAAPIASVDLGDNAAGGPRTLAGPFAQTWIYFATKNNTPGNAYDFGVGLSLFGWPTTGEVSEVVEGKNDRVIWFERQAMNLNGGCPYGACIALLGKTDVAEIEHDRPGAFTHDCFDPRPAPRPVECLDQYAPALTRVTKKAGNRLEYYGYVIQPPSLRPWWNKSFEADGRITVVTERGVLGRFPEFSGTDSEWMGQALGSKILDFRRKSKPSCKNLQPPGCCSQADFDTLNERVNAICHNAASPLSRCNHFLDTCPEMAAKSLLNDDCAAARGAREDACFGGGNDGHGVQIRDRWRTIASCAVEMALKGCAPIVK